MRMKKLRQIIAACMTGCVLLAGCGSTATESTQQSSKLPQLVIGSDSYEPFNYINEDGEFAGVDVECFLSHGNEVFRTIKKNPASDSDRTVRRILFL